jgi:hypothetical protein
MSEVITWAVIGGFLIFGIGLISAIGSRRQHKTAKALRQEGVRIAELALEEQERIYAALLASEKKKDVDEPRTVMSLVSGGGGLNGGEDKFASVGNRSR